jgi:Fe2+ transport system protein B
MIKPIWKNYTEWEEYKNNMYVNRSDKKIINGCIEILISENLKSNMEKTTKDYKISTEVNFTNKMFNPVSWLGQATCNLLIGATAQETCKAWLDMTKAQQNAANNIAKEVIKEWRENYENIQ